MLCLEDRGFFMKRSTVMDMIDNGHKTIPCPMNETPPLKQPKGKLAPLKPNSHEILSLRINLKLLVRR